MVNNGSIQHPDTEALLDYIEDDCQPDQRLHIQHCMHCRKQIDELRQMRSHVQQIPVMQPPADLWNRIEIAVAPKNRYISHMPWLTAVASIIVVASVLLLTPMQQQVRSGDREYISLLEQSRQLESALSYLDQQPGVISLGYAGRLTRIRDSIATIDLTLNDFGLDTENVALRNRLLQERIKLLRQLIDERSKPLSSRYQTF